MQSRGKMMLTLALNKELETKLTKFRAQKQLRKDPDYRPPENIFDCGSSNNCSSDENETDIIAEDLHSENLNEFNAELETGESDVKNILLDIINTVVETHELSQKKMFTKKGLIRKRKTIDLPVSERKRLKIEKIVEKHKVKQPCTEKCPLKCFQKINFNWQEELNRQFWKLEKGAQRYFLIGCIKKQVKKRNTTCKDTSSRRKYSFKYVLKNEAGMELFICKTFLLATLGYDANNDRIIKGVRDSDFTAIAPKRDLRGCHPNVTKIDRNVIIEHIKSFRLTISHYRREHAPKRLYLPSDISVTFMYNNFKEQYPNDKLSYELYRKQVSDMNISFTRLGNEECFECEKFNLHSTVTDHSKTNLNPGCDECANWNAHNEKYVAARTEYQNDGKLDLNNKLVVSADLQKVIMLPRADMFKEVIFIPRLIVFNESFVPVGKSTKSVKPIAAIWHEGVTGRKKEDLISTFYSFLLKNRDWRSITIWLDNCGAQNKNWALFCFFLYAVNCLEVQVENLEIKYFQPGHTFMADDSLHHQVELSMKKKGKIYDFNDFKCAVQEANSSKVDVIDMQINDFFIWKDFTSKYKLQKITPRPYLNDMVFVKFTRGEKILRYKNKFSEEFMELNFLTAKYFKEELPKATPRTECRGIARERKENLIAKLRPIVPINRIQFWEKLEESSDNNDNLDDEEAI